MHPGMPRLRAACLALCVAASTAFAPLAPPPAVGQAAGRTGLIGLRAASSSPEPLSRRELGRALVLLGGASVLPAASQAKMTKEGRWHLSSLGFNDQRGCLSLAEFAVFWRLETSDLLLQALLCSAQAPPSSLLFILRGRIPVCCTVLSVSLDAR